MKEYIVHYYRVLSGPIRVGEENGQRISYFNVLPADEDLDGDVPIIACELNLIYQQQLVISKMTQKINIYYDDFIYEYRAQHQQRDENGNLQRILLEVKNGIRVK